METKTRTAPGIAVQWAPVMKGKSRQLYFHSNRHRFTFQRIAPIHAEYEVPVGFILVVNLDMED